MLATAWRARNDFPECTRASLAGGPCSVRADVCYVPRISSRNRSTATRIFSSDSYEPASI